MNTSSDSRTTWCLLISAAASDGVQLVMADPTTAATSRLAAATSGAPTVVARGPASSSRWARSEQANPANSGPRRSGKNNTNAVVSVLRCGCKKKKSFVLSSQMSFAVVHCWVRNWQSSLCTGRTNYVGLKAGHPKMRGQSLFDAGFVSIVFLLWWSTRTSDFDASNDKKRLALLTLKFCYCGRW